MRWPSKRQRGLTEEQFVKSLDICLSEIAKDWPKLVDALKDFDEAEDATNMLIRLSDKYVDPEISFALGLAIAAVCQAHTEANAKESNS